MRTLIASAVALLVVGCASQPKDETAAPALAGTPETPASAVTASARGSTNPYPGYKRKQKDGRTVYCKKLSRLGSNFVDEYCMSAEEMDRLEDRAQEDRENFRRNQTICGAGTCGGEG